MRPTMKLVPTVAGVQRSVLGLTLADEQVIQMIKEQEASEKTADVCRRYGISDATFYIYGCLSRCKVSSVLI